MVLLLWIQNCIVRDHQLFMHPLVAHAHISRNLLQASRGSVSMHLEVVQAHIMRSLPRDVCAWSSWDVCTKSIASIYIWLF